MLFQRERSGPIIKCDSRNLPEEDAESLRRLRGILWFTGEAPVLPRTFRFYWRRSGNTALGSSISVILTASTAVISGTARMMVSSMPAFRVMMIIGQDPQEPSSISFRTLSDRKAVVQGRSVSVRGESG